MQYGQTRSSPIARRAVGGKAFGFNYFTLPPGTEGREHDHAADGMEEVYFVVRGSGRMRIDGEEVELRPGTFVRRRWRVDAGAARRRRGPRVRDVLLGEAPEN